MVALNKVITLHIEEVLLLVEKAKEYYNQGTNGLEQALDIGLKIREILDKEGKILREEIDSYDDLDGGVYAFIYNCMVQLKRYDGMIPFLEKTLSYLDNSQNPDLWRKLGLLYLSQKHDLKKACSAWKKALDLNLKYLEFYPGLNIVNVYEGMKKANKKISWKIEFVDLETGNFSVIFNK